MLLVALVDPTDEVLLREGRELRPHARRHVRWGERGHCGVGEEVADDGRGLDHGALAGREGVETGGEERLDRRGDVELRERAGRTPCAVSIARGARRRRAFEAVAPRRAGSPRPRSRSGRGRPGRASRRREGSRPSIGSPLRRAGRSSIRVARVPVLQSGWSSTRTGRAGQRTSTGASSSEWTSCSMSSSSVSSAQWTSSTTSATGRSAAACCRNRRMPQASSSIENSSGRRPIMAARRSVTSAPAASVRAASFASAASAPSSLTIPEALFSASASGQNVMPSPYGRQRPERRNARSEIRSRNSAVSLDFPTPASATSRREPGRPRRDGVLEDRLERSQARRRGRSAGCGLGARRRRSP